MSEARPPIEVGCELTFDDLVAFRSWLVLRHDATRRTLRFGQIAVVITGVVVLALAAVVAKFPPVFLFILAVPILASAFLYPVMLRRGVKARVRKILLAKDQAELDLELGAQAVIVDSDGLELRRGSRQARLPWNRVQRVTVDKAHVFVFYDDSSGFIVPRRAFETEADVRDFVTRVEHELRNADPDA